MSALLSPEEVYDGLVAIGTKPERAREMVNARFGQPAAANIVQIVGPTLAFPIRIRLPWTALVSENRRFFARGNRIFMTSDYNIARAKVKVEARKAMTVEGTHFPPLKLPLRLHARVWVPDERVHDVPNFAGAVHNALKKIVYVDDCWVYAATWERMGVDRDAPRCELEIDPW